MTLLIDFSQIVISSAIQYHSQTKDAISERLLRHIALNSILGYKKKFKADYENIWICMDGHNYWRKQIFPHYKQNRKKAHEKSDFDWDEFFNLFNKIKQEFHNDLPFRPIEVDRCEADDIIAVLSQLLCPHMKEIIIVSSDKDLIQIQNICPKVKQWSHLLKKFIDIDKSDYDLFTHVAKGDPGDGIPNILSAEDTFIREGIRQRPVRKKQLEDWKETFTMDKFAKFGGIVADRFARNRTLIDLTQIPEDVVTDISNAFSESERPSKSMFSYLTKHRLRRIMERGDF